MQEGQTIWHTHCQFCGDPLPPRLYNRHAKYCSTDCSTAARKAMKDRERNNSSTRGTISELLIAADLMGKGYSVFRSLSPSCACDLVVMKGDVLKRVEVKTNLCADYLYNSYDILAVLNPGGEIIYDPRLETVFPPQN